MKLIHTIEDLQRNLTEARAKGEKDWIGAYDGCIA